MAYKVKKSKGRPRVEYKERKISRLHGLKGFRFYKAKKNKLIFVKE